MNKNRIIKYQSLGSVRVNMGYKQVCQTLIPLYLIAKEAMFVVREGWAIDNYTIGRRVIYFVIKFGMEKKTYLLSNLKKQVVALKMQLQKLEHKEHRKTQQLGYHSRCNQSVTQSSRFESVSFDGSDFDKGKKRCVKTTSRFKNLSEIIREKSAVLKAPTFSSYKKAEYERTRQNFSSEIPECSKSRSRSPNPVTGEGYNERRKGIRICDKERNSAERRASCRKHFDIYY